MNRVAVVTDSSACLPSLLSRDLPVTVLPITLHTLWGELADSAAGAAGRVYGAIARGEAVKSSPPSPADYLAAIEEADAAAVVVITPAAEFTAMHGNAVVAATLSVRPARVLDCRTAAAAQGLVVAAAAEAATTGAGVAGVVQAGEDAARRAELVAVLENVEFIRQSGHVPSASLGVVGEAGVRPVFRLRGGAVERVGSARSLDRALRRIRWEARRRGLLDGVPSVVFHAAAPDRAESLLRLLGVRGPATEFSPAIGIHTGPGVVGVAWLRAG